VYRSSTRKNVMRVDAEKQEYWLSGIFVAGALFRSLLVARHFWVRSNVPFARRSWLNGTPSYANGLGALSAAPPTPPAPPVTIAASRCPRLIASGFGSGEIRHPAFLALKPHPCGLPRPPANASAMVMGANSPRCTFRLFNVTNVSL